MELVVPSMAHGKSFDEALDEMKNAEGLNFWKEFGSPKNVEEYIRIRLDHAEGRNLPKDWIPSTTYWLVEGEEFIGQTNIRHTLTEHLRKIGGHIGYWIRPTKRKQGFGTDILRLALQKARLLGIRKILITCDETNVPSRKIIEVNGGVLEGAYDMGKSLPRKLRFWCEVA